MGGAADIRTAKEQEEKTRRGKRVMGLQIVKVIVHPKIKIVTVLTLMLFHNFLCGPERRNLNF